MYCIDTSAILDGWSRLYPPDIFPSLWRRLDTLIESGIIISSEEVMLELKKKEDDVYLWAKERKSMFRPIDDTIQNIVIDILKKYPHFVDSASGRNHADPFVVAVAKKFQCKLITGEKNNGNEKKPKIPFICDTLSITCLNLTEFIREQQWTF